MVKNATQKDLSYERAIQDIFYTFVHHGKTISDSDQRLPGYIHYISDGIETLHAQYPGCDLWTQRNMYPAYARVN